MNSQLLGEQHHQEREERPSKQTRDAAHHSQADVALNPRQYADQTARDSHATHEDHPLWNEIEVCDKTEADASDDVRQAEDGYQERRTGLTCKHVNSYYTTTVCYEENTHSRFLLYLRGIGFDVHKIFKVFFGRN